MDPWVRELKTLFFYALLLSFLGCASTRTPIPVGVVPTLRPTSSNEINYSKQALQQITSQYPLSKDQRIIQRVRGIIGELLSIRPDLKNASWRVYVLHGDDVVNAAATQGNLILVWSGITKLLKDDQQLAAVLAHEIGHILAGHALPDPAEEVNRALSGVAGLAARGIARHSPLAAIAESLARESVAALIVNPESQRKELEADQIGVFLMADAGFDPRAALTLWGEAMRGSSGPIEMFSTHPASKTRLQKIREFLPKAMERYRIGRGNSFR
jgi:predicted Zn-dependent protease